MKQSSSVPGSHYVIVGNGPAANRAADVLRDGDAVGRITIISSEFFPFYYRHLLGRFIVGEKTEENLVVRPPSYYKERRIRLRLGQQVVRVDFDRKQLYLKHMEKIHYNKLLLCVGGRPRVPEIHHAYEEHFTVLKTLGDARCLRKRLPRIGRVLILGGDLISVEMARLFLKKKKEVLFLIDGDAFWPLDPSDVNRSAMADALENQGIRVYRDERLQSVRQTSEGRYEVKTRNEVISNIELVGAFYGYKPDVDFLFGSGLDIEQGILVDEQLRTNIADVFAAGDCAQIYNPKIGDYWISVGWPNAEHLGEIAGHNILGETVTTDRPEPRPLEFDGIQIRSPWWKAFDDGR